MPKIYGFDTGFITFVRGWDPLRPQDHGILWEHLVLEHLQSAFPNEAVCYWRDKAGREVDFVLARRRDQIDAIECKWNPSDFNPSALRVFRSYYPKGKNYIVSPMTGEGYSKNFGPWTARICNPAGIE